MKKIIKSILGLKNLQFGMNNEKFRNEWIISKLSEIDNGKRILDAGAGQQRYKQYCSHLKYVSQDFASYNPNDLNYGLQMDNWSYNNLDIISDIGNIPEKDNSFNAILCIEVIEHIPDPKVVFNEFARLLKSGGKLIITAPFCSLTHFAPYHYCTGFSKFYFEKHLVENGFDIIEITQNGNYFEYLAQETLRLQSIAKTYSNYKFSIFENLISRLFVNLLSKISKKDKGSNELLCFGFQIVAVKK